MLHRHAMNHDSQASSRACTLVVRTTLRALVCAVPLALACGARTVEPKAQGSDRALHARLEFSMIGEGKPNGLLAADLDGDGKSELIALTSASSTLQVWHDVSRVLLQLPEPRAIAIDDFPLGPVWLGGSPPSSKDDPASVVFASRAKPGVTVIDVRAAWKSKTDAEVVPLMHVDVARRPRVLASGDLGRDGKFEVAVITIDDDLVLVRSAKDVVTTHLTDGQATCALFSADGESLYVGFQATRRLVRYVFDANGKAVEKSSATLDGLPRAIDELPAEHGAPMRLLVAGGDDAVWSFTNVDKALKAGPKYESGAIPFALVHGRLLDEGIDWVAIALQGQQATVRSSTGTTEAPLARVYAGQHPVAAAIGDFDGDRHADLAIANIDAKRVSVLFGNGRGGFDIAANTQSGRATNSIACGDLNGDGKPDVVALSALEGTLSVLMSDKGVLRAHEVQGRAENADALRLADLDGDGALDAAYLRGQAPVLDAQFGDGQGHLHRRAEVMPVAVGASPGDLLITDIDSDGQLEAIVADPAGGKVALVPIERVNGPGCAFGALRAIDVPSGPRRLALIDVEGDKKSEIAVALAGPGPRLGVAFLRAKKNAEGVLVLEEISHIASTTSVTGLAVADCDQDGLADLALLVSASDSDNHIEVHYQSKEHTWSHDATTDLPTGLRPYTLRAADIDGDSIADFVCSAQNSHHVNVWLNGGGTPIHFARIADLGVGTGPLDVQFADLDGDGALEILVANAFSDDISVIRVR